MTDLPSDRPDPLRAWLEATDGEQGPPGRDEPDAAPSRRLVTVTAAVCAAAVALAFAARGGRADGEPVPSRPIPSATLRTTPTDVAPSTPPVRARTAEPADPAISAAAVLAVRLGAGAGVYVDTAAVEAVEEVAGVTLVTVGTVILRQVGGGWSDPRTMRFAVPVGRTGVSAVALATPWRLAVAAPGAPQATWHGVDDADLRRDAAEAMTTAGYTSVADVQVRRSEDIAGIVAAAAQAVAPGDSDMRRHEVWLSADADRVLGMPAVMDLPIPGQQP